jgi:hypothetical protein
MGCSCGGQPDVTQSETATVRRITSIAYEPLVAVYEDEASENPHVFGCGTTPCGPTASGHPTSLRVDRYSRLGTPHPLGEAHTPTEIELPASLQERYANAHNIGAGPACLPWVRIERDPATFSRCLAAARALGPITSSRQVFDLFHKEGLTQDQEVFYVLLLDTQAQCRGVGEIARGARERVQTPIPDILRLPMVDGATYFVVVHNHPSGKVTPSKADIEITQTILQAGEVVGVPLMDHVIVGADSYYSFYDKKNVIK